MTDSPSSDKTRREEKRAWTDLSDEELRTVAQDNHIWLNALSCINPTEEFKAGVGAQVLRMLNRSELYDSFGLSKTAIIRFNKS